MKFRKTEDRVSIRFLYMGLMGALFAVLMTHTAMAQTFSASIAGTVTDPSGAVVKGAQLKIENMNTKDLRLQTSAANGFYNFTNLLPGPYQISATAPGFKDFLRTNMDLRASTAATVNVQLQVGAAQQQVTVSGSAVLLDTETANSSVTMDEALIQSLPNATLNPLNFVLDLAGTTEAQGGMTSRSQTWDQYGSTFGLNGGRSGESEILVDGAPSTAVDWGGLMVSPIQDSVQEQQVVMNTYDAQYERGAEGVVNLITKGGSDAFHGEVYDFFLNSSLNANYWQSNNEGSPRSKLHQNQFGANIGGPLWKSHHVYFFGAYEGLRRPETDSSGFLTVPTQAEREGDFSHTYNADGSLAVIYNPFSSHQVTDSQGNTYFTRDPIPDNKIPPNLINKVGQAIMNLYPLPNRPNQNGSPNDYNNYIKTGHGETDNDKFDWRVDWSPSVTNRMFVRMTDRVRQNNTPACFFCNGADNNATNDDNGFQVVLNDTYTPSPTWVIDVYGAYTRWWEGQTSIGYGVANASTIGLSPSLFQVNLLPLVNATNYATLGSTYSSYARYVRYLSTGIINITKQLHDHSLKFGFNYDVSMINNRSDQPGTFNFDRNFTSCDPTDVSGAPCQASTQGSDTSGSALASILMGTGNGSANFNMDPAMSLHSFGMYLQDNWRATQKLTVSAGLRYENQRPATERHNRLAYFDKTAVNPLSASFGSTLPGAFEYASVDGRNRSAWEPDNLNFAPRLGLAYQVNDRVVFRAGSGIFYGPASAMVSYDNPGEFPGYTSQTNWVGSQNSYTPTNLVSNPFPGGLNPPTGNSLGAMTLVGNGASQIWPKGPHPIGQIYEWSMGFQYQVSPHSVAEIGYTGIRGRKLLFGNPNFDLDQLPTADLSLGQSLNDQVPNPFHGIITDPTSYLSTPTVARNQLLRPYPEYTYLIQTRSLPGARSQFDALYAKYNHSFANGLSAIVTYQWSKNMDDGSEALLGWTINDMWRDATNPKLDYAISTHDVPNSFAVAFTYQLPYGSGMRWGGAAPWLVRQALGGWNLSGALRIASGYPLPNPAQFSYNPINDYGFPGNGLPNMVPGVSPRPRHRSWKNWINPNAFSGQGGVVCTLPNPACSPFNFQYGNEPQRYSELREAPTKNLDLSVAKSFGPPRIRTQIRADFLNVFNHPIYGGSYNIDTCLDCGSLGTVYGTRNDPRNIQLAAKITF